MAANLRLIGITASLCLSAFVLGQGMQNNDLRDMDGSVRAIERGISFYLNGSEIKSVLSTGDFSEFKLKLNSGQVLVAEARSDTFDPALEILTEQSKVMAASDDRYPGDQRPLLFWRADKDATYLLHVRSFHNKSGGQFFFRYKIFDTIDLSSGKPVIQQVKTRTPFMVKFPMKAGQVTEIHWDTGGTAQYLGLQTIEAISPDGLPANAFLTHNLGPAINALMAPVSGDYYCLENPLGGDQGTGKVRIWTQDIVPQKLQSTPKGLTGSASTNTPALWEVDVKAGEFLEEATPGLNIACNFRMTEAPDFSKFDLSKPDTNPFYPRLDTATTPAPPFIGYVKRAGDNRKNVFYVTRNSKLWLASDGRGASGTSYQISVAPAAAQFLEQKPNQGQMTIANTDFWTFEAKAGDVLNLSAKSNDFSQMIIVQDPELNEIRHWEAGLDQPIDSWRMVVQKPGRYIVAISCVGNGGGGSYTLVRDVLHPKDFSLSMPAKGEINANQVQILRFNATPDVPLLIHWNSSIWNYGISVYNEKGEPADFQHDEIDPNNRFGIIKVSKPQSFIIVLTGGQARATYSLSLAPIPGYKSTIKT